MYIIDRHKCIYKKEKHKVTDKYISTIQIEIKTIRTSQLGISHVVSVVSLTQYRLTDSIPSD